MRRIKTLAIFVTIFVVIFVVAPVIGQASPLNVVVITLDDMRADHARWMPKTEALFRPHGTRFFDSIATTPVCCPSRATFLTGQYAHNHMVYNGFKPLGGYDRLDHSNTLPVWLEAAGWHTALIGKYLNLDENVVAVPRPPGWSSWQALVDYRYFGFRLDDNGELRTYGTTDYQTDVLAALAVSLIRARPVDKPLFLWLAPMAPHIQSGGPRMPMVPRPPRHAGIFRDTVWPLPPAASTARLDRTYDKPFRLAPLSQETYAGIADRWRQEIEALQSADELVEAVVNALSEAGILDNTLLIFTSDNGYFQGEHRFVRGKSMPYDPALQVPLLVRGAGFPAGVTATQPVANIDLAATIVALAGITPGRVLDGRSLLPLALDSTKGRNRYRVIEIWNDPWDEAKFGRPEPSDRFHRWVGVKDHLGQYVEYYGQQERLLARELYMYSGDPSQSINRVNDPAYGTHLARYESALRRYETCAGATCSMGRP